MNKKILLLIIAALIPAVLAGGIIAYLTFSTEKRTDFSPACNSIEIETSNGMRIKNTGTDQCYVRVAVDVADSEKKEKCVFFNLPGEGWNAEYLTGSNGMYGYYYYTKPVAVNGVTSNLFSAVTFKDSTVSKSDIKIYAESILCIQYESYEDAWNEYLY